MPAAAELTPVSPTGFLSIAHLTMAGDLTLNTRLHDLSIHLGVILVLTRDRALLHHLHHPLSIILLT